MSARLQVLEKFSNICTNKLAKRGKNDTSFTVGSTSIKGEGRKTRPDKLMTVTMRLHPFKETSRKVLFC